MSSLRPGQITVTEGATGAPVDITSLNSYTLYQATANEAQTSDLKRSAFAHLRRDFFPGGVPFSLKGGLDVRHSRRDLRGSSPTWNFVGPDGRTSTTPTAAGSDDNAAAFGVLDENFSRRTLPFGFPRLQWVANDKLWGLIKVHPEYFQIDANGDYRNIVSRSKVADEVISSAYLRGDVSFFDRRLKLVGGIRAEQTNDTAEGPLTDPTRNYQRDGGGRILRAANGSPLLIVPTSNALGVSQLTYLDRGLEPGTYIWAPPTRFLDVQGECYLAKHLTLFANLRNLRNTPTTVVERYGPSTPSSARLYQLTQDGASLWTFGLKGVF